MVTFVTVLSLFVFVSYVHSPNMLYRRFFNRGIPIKSKCLRTFLQTVRTAGKAHTAARDISATQAMPMNNLSSDSV
jgi:hypothetical protein